MFRGASDFLVSDVGMKRAGRGRMAALCLALLLHAGAVLLMVTTEVSLVGMAVFLLVWIMLNCLWLALLRRPTVAALISLGILIALTLLSRFKFDKLWMTIDFVDVMIVDRDTTAFLLEIFPALALVDPAGGCGDGCRDRHRLAAGSISRESPDQPRWLLDIGCDARCRVAVLADRTERGF